MPITASNVNLLTAVSNVQTASISSPISDYVSKVLLKAAKLTKMPLFAHLVTLAINSIIHNVSVVKLLVVALVSKTSKLVKLVSIFTNSTRFSKLVTEAVKMKIATNASIIIKSVLLVKKDFILILALVKLVLKQTVPHVQVRNVLFVKRVISYGIKNADYVKLGVLNVKLELEFVFSVTAVNITIKTMI